MCLKGYRGFESRPLRFSGPIWPLHNTFRPCSRHFSDASDGALRGGYAAPRSCRDAGEPPAACSYPGAAPQGPDYTNDCEGKLVNETCTVSCAAGYVGNPETWTCGIDQVFSGIAPTCDFAQVPALTTPGLFVMTLLLTAAAVVCVRRLRVAAM